MTVSMKTKMFIIEAKLGRSSSNSSSTKRNNFLRQKKDIEMLSTKLNSSRETQITCRNSFVTLSGSVKLLLWG